MVGADTAPALPASATQRYDAVLVMATRGMIFWMNFEGDFVRSLQTSLLWSLFSFLSFADALLVCEVGHDIEGE